MEDDESSLRIQKGNRKQILSESQDEGEMNDSSIEQLLEDEDGNLYIEDENGELMPYQIPNHL